MTALDYLLHSLEEVDAESFYSDVFRLGTGSLQIENEPPGQGKTNPIIIGSIHGKMKRRILFEDTFFDTLHEFNSYDFSFISGCSYWGKKNTADRQDKLYALIFDIDSVDADCVRNFLFTLSHNDQKHYPEPQYIVASGNGIHLYYVFQEPISLYPEIKTQIKDLKYYLTRRLWNPHTSNLKKEEDVQYQGINQAFRAVGSKTKQGGITRAFRYKSEKITIDDLNKFVPEEHRVDTNCLYKKSTYTLEEAKKKFPNWYEWVVVGGKPAQWHVKEDLYQWCKRKIVTDATYGHRYFCIMTLAIFAVKCGIYDRDRVKNDALDLLEYLNSLNPSAPFTEQDIDSALECMDLRYVTFPRKDLEKLSAIKMPANKRNGRTREVHLAGARAIQKINDEFNGTNWRTGNGRPDLRWLVRDYAYDNYFSTGKKVNNSEIARALQVSRSTVVKWLKGKWWQEHGLERAIAQGLRVIAKD